MVKGAATVTIALPKSDGKREQIELELFEGRPSLIGEEEDALLLSSLPASSHRTRISSKPMLELLDTQVCLD